MKKSLNRRSFFKRTGSGALGATALSFARAVPESATETRWSFKSAWAPDAHRPWPGPEYWPNPLQDWRINEGRLECFSPGGDRNVALLTREVAERSGELELSVRFGRIDDRPLERGFIGFRVGIKHQLNDYRSAAIYGRGMNIGINADGRLFLGSLEDSAPKADFASEIHLQVQARPSAGGYTVALRATRSHDGRTVMITREIPGEWLTGGLALVCGLDRLRQQVRRT